MSITNTNELIVYTNSRNGLGIRVLGAKRPTNKSGIYIKQLLDDGLAQRDGRLKVKQMNYCLVFFLIVKIRLVIKFYPSMMRPQSVSVVNMPLIYFVQQQVQTKFVYMFDIIIQISPMNIKNFYLMKNQPMTMMTKSIVYSIILILVHLIRTTVMIITIEVQQPMKFECDDQHENPMINKPTDIVPMMFFQRKDPIVIKV